MCFRSSIQGHSFAGLLCHVRSGAWDVLFSLRPSHCILDYMSFLLVSRWSDCCPITNRIMYAVFFFSQSVLWAPPVYRAIVFHLLRNTKTSVRSEWIFTLPHQMAPASIVGYKQGLQEDLLQLAAGQMSVLNKLYCVLIHLKCLVLTISRQHRGIVDTPLCPSKPLWLSFFCETQTFYLCLYFLQKLCLTSIPGFH